MKNKVLLLIALSCGIITTGFGQGKLEVKVKNVKEAKGSIRVGLFLTEKEFLKNPIEGQIVKAEAGEVRVVFENLKKGEYGISVVHDENDNGELDSNFMGIPKEGFGFGNNAMGTFGPPSFDKAKVILKDEDVKQEITLKYM